jgi:hypothetical protein
MGSGVRRVWLIVAISIAVFFAAGVTGGYVNLSRTHQGNLSRTHFVQCGVST